MNLKAIIHKIASRFKTEAKVVETHAVIDAEAYKAVVVDGIRSIVREEHMSTPAEVTAAAPTGAGNNVNTAVQVALALKALDASLSVDAIQAATSAALAAAYPVVAAA